MANEKKPTAPGADPDIPVREFAATLNDGTKVFDGKTPTQKQNLIDATHKLDGALVDETKLAKVPAAKSADSAGDAAKLGGELPAMFAKAADLAKKQDLIDATHKLAGDLVDEIKLAKVP
jgi:hypothetical protein